eukprot:Tbor_TRINITY_DN4359_c0_g4::TRINITY_DN4359_c0_g4_i2::g.7730::m.7730
MTIRLFLDVDNTLYNADVTGFENFMQSVIHKEVESYTGVPHADSGVLSTDYYIKYGLTVNGLIRHHGSKERPIRVREYVDAVHSVDYTNLHSQAVDQQSGKHWLREMLLHLCSTVKCDMWLFTNAHNTHALRCTEALGVSDLFLVKDEEKKKTRPYRLIDCFDQWDDMASKGYISGYDITTAPLYNKPMKGAYLRALKIAEDFCTTDGVDIDNSKVINIMVDDSLANLRAPGEMGWVTIWVSHGKSMPDNLTHRPSFVIETVRELPRCVTEIKAGIEA